MTTNQIKPFATGPGANIVSQNEWETLPALLSGFTAGKASSAQINKALRQTSFIAAALAEFVSEKSGQDVLDDGDVAGFVAKLSSGIAANYLSREKPFADIKADGAAAVSTALANLGLGDAAKRNVGTGAGQIPDMSAFQSGANSSGVWVKLPNGFLIQRGGIANTNPAAGIDITFPTPFLNQPSVALNATASVSINTNYTGVNQVRIGSVRTFGFDGTAQANGVSWLAVGF